MVRLVMLADTHVPARARDLPDEVWSAVDAADVVLHAGDWVSLDLVERLSRRARRLVGCFGNNDGPSIRAVLPEVAQVTLEDLRFVVVHETGAAQGRERRVAAAYPDADVVVFGHSHIPWDSVLPTEPGQAATAAGSRTTEPSRRSEEFQAAATPRSPEVSRPPEVPRSSRSLRLLNPGSPTDRRRQPFCTYLTAEVHGRTLANVELHRLPPRTARHPR